MPTASSPLFEPLQPGDPRSLGGYEIRARLGAGGMGRVYLGATPSGRRLAVKVVRDEYAEEPEFRSRFRREIEAAERVRGPYTAAVVDADPEARPPWLAVEYVPGPSLSAAVAGHGALPESSVRTLLAGVAEALHAVHRAGLVHRDLKPSNVLLGPSGPVVIDFGIARALDATPLTRTGLQMGTPLFMAPEQALGRHTGPPADVWALGALAFYAATGRRPFGEGPEQAVLYRVVHEEPDLTGCPTWLLDLVRGALEKDPGRRTTVADVMTAYPAAPAGPGWLPDDVLRSAARYADTPPGPVFIRVPPPGPARPPSTSAAGASTGSDAAGAPPTAPPPAASLASGPGSMPPPPPPSHTRRRRGRLVGGIVSFGVVAAGAALAATVVLQPDPSEDAGNEAPPSSAATGESSGASGSRPVEPGTYPVDEPLGTSGNFTLVLTEVRVEGDELTAVVEYRYSGFGALITCAGAEDPAASLIRPSGGEEVRSTATFCSENPGHSEDISSGGSFEAYARFPADQVTQPFDLEWQPGGTVSGEATGVTLD